MEVVRLALFIFIVFQETKTVSAVCSTSLSCDFDFDSNFCQFDNGSHGTNTDTWLRGPRWEPTYGLKGNFTWAHIGSADHSNRATVDLTSPPVCSGGPIQVSIEYIVNAYNSQLQVLTRCDGHDTTDVHTYSHYRGPAFGPDWNTAAVTFQTCPRGDTQVVFRGSLNVTDAIGVDTVSIAPEPYPTTRILQPVTTQKPTFQNQANPRADIEV